MMKKNHLLLLLIILIYSPIYGQNKNYPVPEKNSVEDSISIIHINTDSLFNSRQVINILSLKKSSLNKYQIKLGYSKSALKKTSSFGETGNAEAAINGSYFDMQRGGSVTYLEVNDSVFGRTKSSKSKWGKPHRLINGAVIISKKNQIVLQKAKPDSYYEKSKKERAVLVAGPILLLNSKPVELAKTDFVTKRHPRTCICITKDSILFITIDGRSIEADGMNLHEVQKFLLDLGCADAINLDGGGSTTMWLKNKGVINHPSDAAGERPVANVFLIMN